MGRPKKGFEYNPNYAVAPGETLVETLDALGMTQQELSERIGLDKKTVNQIIKGKHPITPETARRLEFATGVPDRIWNNLENQYRDQLIRVNERERLETDKAVLDELPLNDLVRLGYVSTKKDKNQALKDVLSFFGFADVPLLRQYWQTHLASDVRFRLTNAANLNIGSLAAWLRIGEIEAGRIETAPYSERSFKELLVTARRLTRLPIQDALAQLESLCASSGVALVVAPAIKGAPVNGSARWLKSDKALIQLSTRYKTDDQFWFSFFHESCHILKHGKKSKFITIEDSAAKTDAAEQEADQFAADWLIPKEYAARLLTVRTQTAIVC